MYRQYVYMLRQMNLRKKMAQNSTYLFFKKPLLNNLHFQNVWPTGNEFPANNLQSSFAPKHWSVKFSTIAYTLARKHFKIFVDTTSAITFRLDRSSNKEEPLVSWRNHWKFKGRMREFWGASWAEKGRWDSKWETGWIFQIWWRCSRWVAERRGNEVAGGNWDAEKWA